MAVGEEKSGGNYSFKVKFTGHNRHCNVASCWNQDIETGIRRYADCLDIPAFIKVKSCYNYSLKKYTLLILRVAIGFMTVFNVTFHKPPVLAQGLVHPSDSVVDWHINRISGNQFWTWSWPWLALILKFFYTWFWSYLISTQYLFNILFFCLTQPKYAFSKWTSITLTSIRAKKSSPWQKILGFLFSQSSI